MRVLPTEIAMRASEARNDFLLGVKFESPPFRAVLLMGLLHLARVLPVSNIVMGARSA